MKAIFAALLLSCQILMATPPQGRVVAWGGNAGWDATGAANIVTIGGHVLSNAIAVAAAEDHSLALLADGTVVGWVWNASGQAVGYKSVADSTNGVIMIGGEVLRNVKAIAAGFNCSLALKTDGRVVGWGNVEVPAGLSNVVAIATGGSLSTPHCLALKNDGTVVGWPGLWGERPAERSTNSPQFTNLVAAGGIEFAMKASRGKLTPRPGVTAAVTNAIAVAVSGGNYGTTLVLKKDGTVAAWSSYRANNMMPVPPGLSNVVAIAAGDYASLVLKNDGTVQEWSTDGSEITVPAGLSNVVAIAAGEVHGLALKRDGTIVAWGDNTWHQTNVPSGLNHVAAIAAGGSFSLAIQTNSAGQ